MGIITLTTFMSIDGVMQSPGGPEEDTSGTFQFGGWLMPFSGDPAFGATMGPIFDKCSALLLGRSTYDSFKAFWPQVSNEGNSAGQKINHGDKYVVSATMTDDSWKGTHILRDPLGALDELRVKYADEIQVHGSAMLARTLLAHNVFDEMRLLVFPIVLGRGTRLFDETSLPGTMKLVSSTPGATGLLVNVYRRVGDVQTGLAKPGDE